MSEWIAWASMAAVLLVCAAAAAGGADGASEPRLEPPAPQSTIEEWRGNSAGFRPLAR